MAPKLRTSLLLASACLLVYIVFWTDSFSLDSKQHPIDVLHGGSETAKSFDQERPLNEIPSMTTSHNEWKPKTTTLPSTRPTEAPEQELPVVPLQEQFQQEYEALGLSVPVKRTMISNANYIVETRPRVLFMAPRSNI